MKRHLRSGRVSLWNQKLFVKPEGVRRTEYEAQAQPPLSVGQLCFRLHRFYNLGLKRYCCFPTPRADVSSDMTQTAFESTENRQKQNDWRALSPLPKFHSCYLCGAPAVSLDLGPVSPLTLRVSGHSLVNIYFQAIKAGNYQCRGWQCGL